MAFLPIMGVGRIMERRAFGFLCCMHMKGDETQVEGEGRAVS